MAIIGEPITVTVTIDERRVTLEGPEEFVRTEVQRLTDAVASSVAKSAVLPHSAVNTTGESVSEAKFVAAKRPSNHAETVAVLACCLKQRGAEEFNEEDVKRAYRRAQLRPPKVVAQAIRDAKNVFDYIEQGSARGIYRLSHHGETTVLFDLPRSGRHEE